MCCHKHGSNSGLQSCSCATLLSHHKCGYQKYATIIIYSADRSLAITPGSHLSCLFPSLHSLTASLYIIHTSPSPCFFLSQPQPLQRHSEYNCAVMPWLSGVYIARIGNSSCVAFSLLLWQISESIWVLALNPCGSSHSPHSDIFSFTCPFSCPSQKGVFDL